MLLDFLNDTIIVTGHYGTGKTNLSVNLAYSLAANGKKITLADLDIVNPYFRSADFKEKLEQDGMGFVSSVYANSNVDVPALSPALDPKIGAEGTLIVDVGGDDAGAFALGRYSARIKEKPYTMIYVVNAYRYLTRKPEEAIELLKEIETASRLKVTHIANNSNLSGLTTVEDIQKSMDFARKIAEIAGMPLAFTSVKRKVYELLPDKQGFYPVDIYVKAPWSEGE